MGWSLSSQISALYFPEQVFVYLEFQWAPMNLFLIYPIDLP